MGYPTAGITIILVLGGALMSAWNAKPVSVGDRFNRFVVLRELEAVRTPNGTVFRRVECECDCGTVKVVRLPALRSGKTKSCGCLARETAAENCRKLSGRTVHGLAGTPEHSVWAGMKSRCTNPCSSNFERYGGRGITVCKRWMESFEAFLEDMGPRPSSEHSIDRIDNDGNYEPGNCRWATNDEQARNRSNNVVLNFRGEEKLLIDWAEHLGVSADLIRCRIERGWSTEDALTKPVAVQHRADPFYMTPISKRDAEWYREYERRERESVRTLNWSPAK